PHRRRRRAGGAHHAAAALGRRARSYCTRGHRSMTITSLDQVTEFPLTWPSSKPRIGQRQAGAFKVSMAKAQADLETELGHWRIRRWVLSMAPRYRHTLADPAVALWFYMPSKAPVPTAADLRVIACDRYQLIEHNLRAIGL